MPQRVANAGSRSWQSGLFNFGQETIHLGGWEDVGNRCETGSLHGLFERHCHLHASANLGGPPARAHEEEPPVGEKFRWLAFEGMSDELKNPADNEQSQS